MIPPSNSFNPLNVFSRITPYRPSRKLALAAAAVFIFLTAAGAAESTRKQPLPVTPDHTNGVYTVGETIRWRVQAQPPSQCDQATYSLKKGGMTMVREASITLTNGAAEIETRLAEPGTVLLEVKAKEREGKTLKSLGGAVAAPDRIEPSSARPDDFDAFWRAKLEELSKTPTDPQLVPADSARPGVEYWQITMDNLRGSRIRGQLARPKEGQKLPAMLIVQWAGVYGLQKGWVTDPAGSGWLVLNINAHDLPIDQTPEFYKQQSEGPLKDYPAIGNEDRETSYFLRMYLSCYRGAQYLVERPDWDGKTLLVTGGSQGGLQALMTAGFHPKVTAAIASVPAGCDMTGPDVGRSPGWPMWYWKTEGKDAAKVRQASRYFDVVNFASLIRCPALVGVGLIDETCPPAGIFAALNQAKGPKEIVILPKGDHMGSFNSHRAFNERSGVWKAELCQGRPAPVRNASLP